jgi:hypothetical protein
LTESGRPHLRLDADREAAPYTSRSDKARAIKHLS